MLSLIDWFIHPPALACRMLYTVVSLRLEFGYFLNPSRQNGLLPIPYPKFHTTFSSVKTQCPNIKYLFVLSHLNFCVRLRLLPIETSSLYYRKRFPLYPLLDSLIFLFSTCSKKVLHFACLCLCLRLCLCLYLLILGVTRPSRWIRIPCLLLRAIVSNYQPSSPSAIPFSMLWAPSLAMALINASWFRYGFRNFAYNKSF